MANKTYAVHTDEEFIERVDEHARRLRRSRNSFLNEGIEMVLKHYDLQKYNADIQDACDLENANTRRKAGARAR